jgi:plasmid stabilization system protein ParE
MKIVYTDEALRNLDEILGYIASNYPMISTSFQKRLQTVVARIGAWPESAQEVAERPGVRVVPLIRYPYKVFYRITSEAVEVLYIHHAARRHRGKKSADFS